MHRFWDTIIEPVLFILQPKTIVEIGAETGNNTSKLLEFCKQNDAKLHTIDPQPKFDVAEWKTRHGEHFVFHQSLSLNAIHKINKFDVVIIDGDHNWYTVLKELKLIEKHCKDIQQSFPLVMIHDIGWPYGRRDMYYNPENIPDAFRKPFKQQGMYPGSAELLDEGGINPQIFNAIYENTLQNGVLTAVEDFLKETDEKLEFINIPGLNGIGIIISSEMKGMDKELLKFFKEIEIGMVARSHIEKVETERIEKQLAVDRKKVEIKRIRDKYIDKIVKLQCHLNTQAEQIKKLEKQLDTRDKELKTKETAIFKYKEDLDFFQGELNRQNQDIDILGHWIDQLDHGISALLNSRRWKFANAVGEIRRKALLMPQVPIVSDHLNEIIQRFRTSEKRYMPKKNRSSSIKTFSSPGLSTFTQSNEKSYFKSFTTNVTHRTRSVDIVVCVYNALNDVEKCLDSVINNTRGEYGLYLVNDCSNKETTEYLKRFASHYKFCTLLQNAITEGYTKAANIGLRATSADYVVLLNSDTIVPKHWVDRLLECGESSSRIGIIGPLSNAASWQSVPKRFDENGDWAVNSLPDGYSVDEMAQMIAEMSEKRYPRVPFINGFCFVIKREVINVIGYLDEDKFPMGFGEENDYCLRAIKTNFELAVADHAYVYHAKSMSYSHDKRKALSKIGGDILVKKHGRKRISDNIKKLRDESTLELMRKKIISYFNGNRKKIHNTVNSKFRILYLLPVGGVGGGIQSVIQELIGMRRNGVDAQVALLRQTESSYFYNYSNIAQIDNAFFFYDTEQEVMKYAANFHVVIATIYHSVRILKKIVDTYSHILGAYYIQDYEPWFFVKGTENWEIANNSYTLIDNMILMAKTDWLCKIVEEKHGVKVEKISPSLDNDLFFPAFKDRIGEASVKVVAMVRPITPRRGADRTMHHLKKLKKEFGNKVNIEIFGCEDDSDQFKSLDRNFEFYNHGILTRENVAKLFQETDVFIDLSDYQAFGRSGFEAMACGCAVILPSKGGVYEYAVHNENALIVDVTNDEHIYSTLKTLILDDTLRERLIFNGIVSVSKYSIHRASISKLSILTKKYKEKGKGNLYTDINENFRDFVPLQRKFSKKKIKVAGLVSLRPDGTPAGSAHIRVIQPLTHPDVSKYIDFKMCSLSGLWHTNADLLLIQRNMLPKPEIAYELVKYSKRNGKRIVYEIDDDLFQLSKTRRGEGIYPKSSLEAMEVMAVEAHKVIVSSMQLKEKIDKVNRNVICIPNTLDENIWLEKNEKFFIKPEISIKAKDQFRILYMGTRTHAKDLLIVQEAYKLIKKEYGNKVTLQIIGGVPVGEKIFGEVININDSSPMTDNYLGFVKSFRLKNNWHLGLIPLVKSPFNRMKSYIKFLDYSALGIPSICTDIEPYREVVRTNENAILVDNDKESWYIAIKKMIDDETFRNTIADNAYSDLVNKHILCKRVKDFLSAYYYPIEILQ